MKRQELEELGLTKEQIDTVIDFTVEETSSKTFSLDNNNKNHGL